MRLRWNLEDERTVTMRHRRNRTSLVAAGLVAALGLGAGGGAAAYAALADDPTTVVRQVTVGSSEPAASADGLTIGEIYERSYRAVVEITVSGTQVTPFGGSQQRAQGSGFVYGRDGTIVTNQHVVDGAGSVSVRFWDGSTYEAEIVGTDRSTDLAVIRVDAPASVLEPLRLGDSSQVAVGDGVVAMGSPFGLEGTVTSGIVSALHRQMTAPNDFTITDSIQTDAAINHGNSGGPLLNARGRVIGVNAQIESESGGNDGVGFAIPSNTVRSIVAQLLESGKAEHAYLGVTMVTVPDGVAVTEVRSGTPADEAGLRAATGTETIDGQEVPTGGDVVVAVDGSAISSSAELQSAVDAKKPGDALSITVVRDGETRTLRVTLGTRPS
jgi:putative serine protease PepD